MFLLWLLGFVIETIGLAFAVRGFQKTWADYGLDGGFLFNPARLALRHAIGNTRTIARRVALRLWRRPRDVRVVAGTASGVASAFGSVRVAKTYGPLPSITAEPDEFSKAVDARFAELLERLQSTEHRLIDDLANVKGATDQVRNELETRIGKLEDTTKQIAVGGLRLQVAGWALVFVGFFIQGLAQMLQLMSIS